MLLLCQKFLLDAFPRSACVESALGKQTRQNTRRHLECCDDFHCSPNAFWDAGQNKTDVYWSSAGPGVHQSSCPLDFEDFLYQVLFTMDYLAEQREEVESLKSIFPLEFSELSSSPPSFMIRLDDREALWPCPLQLKVTLPDKYPSEIPIVGIPNRSNALPQEILKELLEFIHTMCKEYIGMPVVFSIVSGANDWIAENSERIKKTSVRETEEEEKTRTAERGKAGDTIKVKCTKERIVDLEFGRQEGRWNYVIGLIGEYV